MIPWKFDVFVSVTGRCDSQDVINRYNPKDSIFFERAVAHLAITPRNQWNEPHAKDVTPSDKKFKSAGFKLYEIRYKANQRQERPFGYFPEGENTFVILLICYHKGSVYVPPDAFSSAFERFKTLQSGQASRRPLQIDGETFPQNEET